MVLKKALSCFGFDAVQHRITFHCISPESVANEWASILETAGMRVDLGRKKGALTDRVPLGGTITDHGSSATIEFRQTEKDALQKLPTWNTVVSGETIAASVVRLLLSCGATISSRAEARPCLAMFQCTLDVAIASICEQFAICVFPDSRDQHTQDFVKEFADNNLNLYVEKNPKADKLFGVVGSTRQCGSYLALTQHGSDYEKFSTSKPLLDLEKALKQAGSQQMSFIRQ